MTEAPDGSSRPLSLVAARLGANAAGLALAAGLFAGIVYATGLAVTRDATPLAAPAATLAAPTVRPSPPAATPIATAAPTPAPTAPAATPPATAAPPPISTSLYPSGGRTYLALGIRTGSTVTAPYTGRVQITVYQLIGGQILVGSNDRTQPFYPYVFLTGGDQRITYRLSALTTDSVLLVEDGQTVSAGDPLFRVVGSGPSSWNAFYDPSVTAQVLVSLTNAANTRELDAAPLFR